MKNKRELAIAADCFRDPVIFARKVLRHETWSTQEAILRAIRDYPRVAVKGCHASSKTFAIAEAVLFWLARWPKAVVVTTGPSWTQVKEIVWGEIHKAAAGSRFPYPPANQTELRLANGSYAIGLSTNEAVRFQGFHGEHVLIIADEAPGLRADMWEAIEGARAGGEVHIVALGNPTIPGASFTRPLPRSAPGGRPSPSVPLRHLICKASRLNSCVSCPPISPRAPGFSSISPGPI